MISQAEVVLTIKNLLASVNTVNSVKPDNFEGKKASEVFETTFKYLVFLTGHHPDQLNDALKSAALEFSCREECDPDAFIEELARTLRSESASARVYNFAAYRHPLLLLHFKYTALKTAQKNLAIKSTDIGENSND